MMDFAPVFDRLAASIGSIPQSGLLIVAAFLMIEGGGLTDLVGIATAVLAAGLQKKLGARQLAPAA